jgi:DedD protein
MSGSDKSPADFNPQHRVVGAIVLVVIAIVIVPMVLKENQLTSRGVSNEVTVKEKDAKVYVSRAEDILRAQNAKNSPPGNSKTASINTKKASIPLKSGSPAVVNKSAPGKQAVKQEPEQKTANNKPAETIKKSTPAKKITKGWVVQIGTYSDPANAKKVRASLIRHGYHVRLEKIKLSRGNATRVRVGPFSDRGKAITTLSHIGRDVGLQGVVLKYP